MNKGINVYILRVFVNKEGKFGNPVGIVLDEKQEMNPANRQAIATKVGFSESVFVNDLDTGKVNIFNPQKEVDFAGHALVGTAYFINNVIKKTAGLIRSKGGHVLTWQKNDLTWIRSSLNRTPPWHHKQFQNVASIENLSRPQILSMKHTVVWTWIDQKKGIVRARTFAPDWGIQEDEANGSGSMQLAAQLSQNLEIHHGKGSIIYAKPAENGRADIGGRVKQDKLQKITIK